MEEQGNVAAEPLCAQNACTYLNNLKNRIKQLSEKQCGLIKYSTALFKEVADITAKFKDPCDEGNNADHGIHILIKSFEELSQDQKNLLSYIPEETGKVRKLLTEFEELSNSNLLSESLMNLTRAKEAFGKIEDSLEDVVIKPIDRMGLKERINMFESKFNAIRLASSRPSYNDTLWDKELQIEPTESEEIIGEEFVKTSKDETVCDLELEIESENSNEIVNKINATREESLKTNKEESVWDKDFNIEIKSGEIEQIIIPTEEESLKTNKEESVCDKDFNIEIIKSGEIEHKIISSEEKSLKPNEEEKFRDKEFIIVPMQSGEFEEKSIPTEEESLKTNEEETLHDEEAEEKNAIEVKQAVDSQQSLSIETSNDTLCYLNEARNMSSKLQDSSATDLKERIDQASSSKEVVDAISKGSFHSWESCSEHLDGSECSILTKPDSSEAKHGIETTQQVKFTAVVTEMLKKCINLESKASIKSFD